VATLQPFRALLYAPSIDPALVTSPPYDVISAAERQRLEGLHPYNIISLILGAELPGDEPGSDKYARSAAHLRDWIAAGVLVPEDRPHLYAYRMDYEIGGVPGSSGGVIGALDLEPVASGGIHPHERTMPKPRSDRLELMRTTQANLEPIWLVGGPGVVGPAVGAASQLAALMRASNGSGPWERTMALISDPAEAPPALLAIHRLTDLSVSDFSDGASLEPYAGDLASLVRHLESVGPGTVGVADSSGRWTMPTRGPLDTAWLAGVLEAAGASVAYEHDIEEVAAGVGGGNVAFLLAPIPIQEVVDSALAGRVMPPKSTLFWPKPRTGLLLRDQRLG
jgi:hypothetical protein